MPWQQDVPATGTLHKGQTASVRDALEPGGSGGRPCVGRAVLWDWEHRHPRSCCRASWGAQAVALMLPSLSAQGFLEESAVLVPSEMGPAALQPHNPLVSRPQNLERVREKKDSGFQVAQHPQGWAAECICLGVTGANHSDLCRGGVGSPVRKGKNGVNPSGPFL